MGPISGAVRIETDSFLIQLPSGWKIEELSGQARVAGPNDELVIISSTRIVASESAQDLEKLRANIGNNIKTAMTEAADHPDLVMKGSLIQTEVQQCPFFALQCETKDGSYFFDQFGIVSQWNAVLVTVEGDSQHKQSSAVVRNAIENMVWHKKTGPDPSSVY